MLDKKLFFLDEIPDLRLVDYRIILFTAIKNNEIDGLKNFNESVVDKRRIQGNFFLVCIFFIKNFRDH